MVGITGRKFHGKDTAANPLVKDMGFEIVKFAGALKNMTGELLKYVGYSPIDVYRCIEGDLKETPLECFGGKSPRYVMQTLGTDWGRYMIWDSLWTNAFIAKVRATPLAVCTDLRFPNELKTIRMLGGISIRVVRPNYVDDSLSSQHVSERHIASLGVDFEVVNDGTEEDLATKIKEIVLQ